MTSVRRLEGKVAIVTGGASGIGAATARRLTAEGARVAIGDVNGARAELLAAELGDTAVGIQFDAGDVASVEQLVERTVAQFGRLEIVSHHRRDMRLPGMRGLHRCNELIGEVFLGNIPAHARGK